MLLFGSMGAITWAIRGTSGWGGIDGTIVPGLMWGLLWYYLCWRKGIDARGIVLWLGLGLALGGELGYGQYVSWIRGSFETGEGPVPISPATGYLWFAVCGIGWAAPGGILLGWALHSHVSRGTWVARALLFLVLLVFLFDVPLPGLGAGAVSGTGAWLARTVPGLLFPLADSGLYDGELQGHIVRTVYTNTQNAAVVVWWLCALLLAVLQRDRATLVCGSVLGIGFGAGFALSAVWCLGYSIAPRYIDWWKMWELHAGFNLGLVYALLWFWAVKRFQSATTSTTRPPAPAAVREGGITLFLAVAGMVLILAASIEYFPATGLFLAGFYALSLILTVGLGCRRHGIAQAPELRRRVSLVYSAFLLVFMLVHGGTSQTGAFLELYTAAEVDQYAWPLARIALFLPPATVLVLVAGYFLARTLSASSADEPRETRLPSRMVDLFAFTGIIGAVSIWPSEIGVLYAVFLFLALFAFTRLNRHFDRMDTEQ